MAKRFRTLLLAFATIATSGCGGFSFTSIDSFGDVEGALIYETDISAKAQGVRVRGEITDMISPAQLTPGQEAPVAWYNAGVAWYYRPQVKKHVALEREGSKESARNVATHEVCHAKNFHHDIKHWECMNKWAQPTYQRPQDDQRAAKLGGGICLRAEWAYETNAR